MMVLLESASLVELRLGTVQFDWSLLTSSCPNLEIFRCKFLLDVNVKDLITKLALMMPY